jgi:hypothetical protein
MNDGGGKRKSRSSSKNKASPERRKQASEAEVSNQASTPGIKALAGGNVAQSSLRDVVAEKDVEMLETIESNIAVATWIDNWGRKAKDQSVSQTILV